MSQLTFAEAEYSNKKRQTRREKFLLKMDELIPWKKLEKRIRPVYPTVGNGRRPYPLSVMLRVHCMQLFYNLSDPAMEDALYEIESMRRFAGLRLSDNLPDETTILKFRHLLETHNLGKKLFQEINNHLAVHGLALREGTIVDATIISAPSSTKNRDGKRDPEMHQTKKGNEWQFGMKMHIGVDDGLGLIHSIETTGANEHDITRAEKLLHGDEQRVWGDAGYLGIEKRSEHEGRDVDWHIAMRPGRRRKLAKNSDEAKTEKIKAQVRAKVEHPFLTIKRIFGYSKVRYRGLAKNTERLYLLAGFTNLLKSKGSLLA
ncbi:IS5 family transposase [Microbulbifer sp. 2205BS26-8]|uniref:IS5 family transposase n=1 Tax=Microbulbifer sp. 2205BS26-8 TaxID=3064386 RepID=UPI003530B18F